MTQLSCAWPAHSIFFFNDTATTEIYTLSLHDALPIYEASDNGLLSPDLAAGIRRVKGAKRLGMRLGNWLTPAQGKQLLELPDLASVRGKRNFAMLAVLLGCGLRRAELTKLTVSDLQQRDNHWAIIDLFGKGGSLSLQEACSPGSA